MRDYQTDIANKACALLHEYRIAYLSMQVRTGKTRTAIYAAQLYGAKRVLFLTKKKAIQSIVDDYHALGAPFETFLPINYDQLHNIPVEGWDLIICDESHCLSQLPVPAERTKLLKKVAENKPVIYLSGSPTPESYSQIYHQLWISSFSPFAEWPTFYKWARDGFVNVKKRYFYNREVNDYSNANKDLIDRYTKHLFISYSQQEAGFTSMVEEHILHVPMQKTTYWLADKLKKTRVYISKTGDQVICDTEVKLMQKLHQVYSGTVIIDNQERKSICFDDTKVRYIKEHFEGEKIAIFYKFVAEATMLQWHFAGSTTTVPEDFNASEDKIFIGQIAASREGINLSTADALVFMNIDFSHVSYIQARARLQDRNRSKPAPIYWIFSEGGIEDKVYQRVMNKQDYQISYFLKDFGISRNKVYQK